MDTLYIALELSAKTWKLGFRHPNKPGKTKVKNIPARNWFEFDQAIKNAKDYFKTSDDCPIASLYEAGRDGFWIHRGLIARNIENLVVDSASILVSRRKRNPKSDNIDVRGLLDVLEDHHRGRSSACIVEVPTTLDEDDRHLHRELEYLKGLRTSVSNRIKALLIGQGVECASSHIPTLSEKLDQLRDGNGEPLGGGIISSLMDLCDEYNRLSKKITKRHVLQDGQIKAAPTAKLRLAAKLCLLRGIGNRSAWILAMEVFGWRTFNNRKQAGGYTGLTPTPSQSGASFKEQGISKAGNVRIRWLMVELAWLWVQHQPDSEITQWYQKRTSGNGRRHKKVVIVAVARKLFIALWRYLTQGIEPKGAVLSQPVLSV